MPQHIERLQYITHGSPAEQISAAQAACEAGVKWIQLRLKNETDAILLSTAEKVKQICREHNATFIVNDHIYIALATDADGVHLGKEDRSPAEARILLGGKIIGATANTLEDIEQLAKDGVDYIGLGPYRFTSTKEKLSPVLGLKGYRNILTSLKLKNIHIPVVAIGGLNSKDVKALRHAGLHGVAVSSAITNAADKKEIVSTFYSSLNNEISHETTDHSR